MRKIPAALNVQFDALLVKNKIPQKFHSHYLKWLRYYLDFCQRYRFSESNSPSLPNFIRKLKEKRQTDVQQKQANEAIHIYYELIRSKSSNNTSELPTRFAIVLPAIYYRLIMTFVPFKNYWGIAMCEPR